MGSASLYTLIASFPKSGRTWLSFLIANYLNLQLDLVPNVNFETVYKIIQSDGATITPLDIIAEDNCPNFIATHALPNRVEADRIIRLTRNPYDVIVSFYFHLTKHWVSYSGTFSEYLRDENWGVSYFKQYQDAWKKKTDIPTLWITYEDLQSKTEEVLSRALTFGKVDHIDLNIIQQAIGLSSFDALQQLERTGPRIPQHQYDLSDPHALRVRIGTVGSAAQFLSQVDADFISASLSIPKIVCTNAYI